MKTRILIEPLERPVRKGTRLALSLAIFLLIVLITAGSATALAAALPEGRTSASPGRISTADPQAAALGQWGPLMDWPLVAVHMALLHTGQVLVWDAWELSSTNSARLWNPATGEFTVVPNPYSALFCAGESQLADGHLLGVGGHNGADVGITQTVTFDPVSETWTQQTGLNLARWYPSSLPLSDGRSLALGGEITASLNATIPEVYDPISNTWTLLPGADLDVGGDYPQSYLLPDGRVFMNSGPADRNSRTLDLASQAWSIVGLSPVANGATAMYLPGKILGSGGGDPVLTTTAVIDMNAITPTWTVTGPMAYPRVQHNLVLLPTGDVLAVGGAIKASLVTTDSGVLPEEMWDPDSMTWTTMAAMTDMRMYHSTAVLLPDGSVLSAGGGRMAPANDYPSAQIYYPPYFFQGARPAISSAPVSTTYGADMTILTPDAASISSVAFMRLGSVTHTFNPDQRYIPLNFSSASGRLTAQSPADGNIAPPGYYMLFIVNSSGVPSVASIVHIGLKVPGERFFYFPIVGNGP